ncbi:serine hydrolase [bacterium]|nr:serine hydrolase [bacterium]
MVKKSSILTTAFIFLFLFSSHAAAQVSKEDPRIEESINLIQTWVEAQLDYNDIPGMSVSVVYDQDILWTQGFGFADKEKKIETTPSTIYSICSISKLFTSISVMQLRDQGKIDLDEPIQTYLPWFDIKDKYPKAPEITLRRILTHSSGLPRESDYPYWTGPDYPFPTLEEIKKRISSQEELYPGATYFQYSNLGMALAGQVVAEVSGQPYDQYVKEHILDPLGLKDTAPEIPLHKSNGQLATGYSGRLREGGRKVIPEYQVRGMAPAAGFTSTVVDLGKFASWQFQLLEKEEAPLFNPYTLKEMYRVHWVDPDWDTTWGLGFSINHRDEKTFVGHGGSCPGYKSRLLMCPEDKLAVVVMTNAHDVSPGDYAYEIYDIIAPEVSQVLEKPEEVKPRDSDLEKYTGRYIRPIGRETQVLVHKGDLALLYLPTDNPMRAINHLQRVGKNTWRRVRDDGNLGEKIKFEVDEKGRVTRFIRFSQYAVRVR